MLICEVYISAFFKLKETARQHRTPIAHPQVRSDQSAGKICHLINAGDFSMFSL